MTTIANDPSLTAISQQWAVELVQAGKLQEQVHNGKPWTTAIYKQPLEDQVEVNRYGIVGDEHTGRGPDLDRAVCFHPLAHYSFWRAYFRREIPIGFFGENLTLSGVVDEEICVGDVIRCGTVLMQITQPRTPCFKQANKMDVPNFVRLLLQTGKIGFLARVLEPGTLQVGDVFQLIERPCPQAPLVYVNRIKYERDNIEAARELAQLEPLAHDWHAEFAKRVSLD